MILGYIVTEKKVKNIDSSVAQVSKLEEADATKPILLVGWKKAKKHSNYSSILERQIGENLYWTFNKSESRSDFEEDLEKFYNIIYNNILNNIIYYYIDIFKLKYNKIKKIYNIILSNNKYNIYISKNIVYIPFDCNKILGLSLDILEYCGIKREKVLNIIKSNPNVRIYEDNNKFIFKLTKRLGNKRYAVPYFISS